MQNDPLNIQDDMKNWERKEAFLREAFAEVLPPEGVEWAIADFRARYESYPEVQSIMGVYKAIAQNDPIALRAAILSVVQEAVQPWVGAILSLERDLYHTLVASNCTGRA